MPRTIARAASLVTFLVGVGFTPLHAQSALDGFNPGANSTVSTMAVQSDGKILVGGNFTTLGGGGTGTTARSRIGRLHPDGSPDVGFDPGANATVTTLVTQPDGKILVGGSFTTLGGGGIGTTVRNRVARLHADGSLDSSFDPGANGVVNAMAVQPDGKILVGGGFTLLGGGGTGTTARSHIGRLNPDGSIDATFNPGANGAVWAFAVQPNRRILVAGEFTRLGAGGNPVRIGRLHHDGSVDTTFTAGFNGPIHALAVQPDGKILVGGQFSLEGPYSRSNLARLNPDGYIDTTFDPGANGDVWALALQPDARILVGGAFTTLGGGGTGTTPRLFIGRLQPDGSLDADFNPGATGIVSALAVHPDGQILVGGAFTTLGGGTGTTPRFFIGGLYRDGSLDADFNPGADNWVTALAVQPDGKILVGGSFTVLGGGDAGTTPRNNLGRLNPDGSLDATFDPGANGFVAALVVQPDGKILVGGAFTMLGGGGTGTTPRNHLGRLNADGSLDASFDPGANGVVATLAMQPDGKILVGGQFTTLGGGGTGTAMRQWIGRLHPDGLLDVFFDPRASSGPVAGGFVGALAVQADEKIVVGGYFRVLGYESRESLGRLNPDGSLDSGFNPGADLTVRAVAVQPDGRIVVGGVFTTLGGGGTGTTRRNHLGRINVDGSLDATFDPGANGGVFAMAVQSDGQILVGGAFTTLGGGGTGTIARNNIGRLGPDGALDTTFNPGADNTVRALAVPPDGKTLVGGEFTTLGDGGIGMMPRRYLGRLSSIVAATERLGVSCQSCVSVLSGAVQAQAIWARNGAGPEVERVTFDVSSDGVTYVSAMSATRVAGGWQAPLSLSGNVNVFLRARGHYPTGEGNASGSIVESIRQVYLSCPVLASSLPAGSAGLPYFARFTAPGALGVVSYRVNGALPAGMTLSSDGTLTGTPTQAGTFLLTVIATDLFSGCSGSQSVPLSIASYIPFLMFDKTSLRFGAVTTGATFVSQTAAQLVRLTQSGAGTVSWTAVPSQPWLQVSPASGSGSAVLSIGVVAVGGLPVGGSVAGAITLTVSAPSDAPAPITVTLDLIPNGLSAAPFGAVDTPLDNSTGVTGAIPFTGWALDDVEVTRVMVCRAAVGGEVAPTDPNCGGAAQVFVGFPVFIDGARPDVAAFFSTYPASTRGGWGFMVLTNMLPNQGNGTYLFSMYAQDRDRHTTLLGTRAMTCANASATKPFGALDTPTQGGVASGTSSPVFGWVLSRVARADPPGGGTVSVQVNGVTIGSPGGWAARPDLSAVFPGYPGIATALGVYDLNTLGYPNGVHTIQWTVTDHLGITEGIGSRFFTVSNGTAATAADAAASSRVSATANMVAAVPRDDAPVLGRRSWDPGRPWRWYGVGRAGRAVIRGEEIDRFELWLGARSDGRLTGHLRVGDGLATLPAGSQLDEATGWFTWAPGVGFVGTYDLVFVRWAGASAVARHEVRVVLAPKGSGAVGPQVVIDAPRSSQDVLQPFVLGGWAADLTAPAGTGIETVHAWAYPLAGGPPVFLGAASYGGTRPDVAAVHGEPFRDSGFGLMVQGLTRGDYDLAVFAWSTEAADFGPAKVVRVTVR